MIRKAAEPRPGRASRRPDAGRGSVRNADGHSIGVDLGAGAVRAAVVAPAEVHGRPAVTVHGIGEVALPRGAVIAGAVADPSAVTAALSGLWTDNRFECRRVVLGVANQQVVVRPLTMPALPPDQLRRALPFQAREVLPLPVDEAVCDFVALSTDDAAGTVTGLLVAAPRAPIATAVRAVEAAGLHVARVDLAAFGVLRALADEHVTVEAVVDIGASLTNIAVHDHGVPSVVRVVTRGGEEITDALVTRSGLEPAAAEDAKRRVGVSGADMSISAVVLQALRPLVAEIRSSVQYFLAAHPGTQVERVALTGGGADLPGLEAELTRQLGIETCRVAALRHVANRQAEDVAGAEAAASAVAVGLAIGAAA
jgi:type IV pilus assembly protein PilM